MKRARAASVRLKTDERSGFNLTKIWRLFDPNLKIILSSIKKIIFTPNKITGNKWPRVGRKWGSRAIVLFLYFSKICLT